MIEVIHIDAYNTSTGEVETLRFCSSADFIANGHYYLPFIATGLDFNTSLYDSGTTEGSVTVGIGSIVINNPNGDLDFLRKYAFDGRSVTVYKPKDKNDAVTDSTNLFFTGTTAYVELGWNQLTIYLKSKIEQLNVVMQPSRFAGSNGGTGGAGGYEGSIDLKGKTKPQTFGRVYCAQGAVVNQFFLTYAFNYDYAGNPMPLYRVYNVYVKGVRYTWNGTDYATPALMAAASISAGQYGTCLASGMIRLGSTPASNGAVVADVADAPDSQCTAAQVVQRIFERNTTYVPGVDYDINGLLELDHLDITPTGYYVNSDVNKAEVINKILDSIMAWFVQNATGLFRFGYVDLADKMALINIPVCTITKQQWGASIDRPSVQDQSQNIPAYSCTVQHSKVWTTQESGALADSVGITAREFFGNEWRTVEAKNEDILTAHPLAPALSYETYLNEQLYLPLRNGDFSVSVTSANNGWTLGGSATATQSGGACTITPNGVNVGVLSQDLVHKDGVYPGDSEIVFTIPSTAAGSVILTITRNPLSPITLYSETIPVTGADQDIVRTFTLPDGLTQSSGMVTVKFSTVNSSTATTIRNVALRVPQQGTGPEGVATRRLLVNSVLQERYNFPVPQNFYLENGIDIGKMVILQDDLRFDLKNGKPFLVIGVDPAEDEFTVTLDVWRAGE